MRKPRLSRATAAKLGACTVSVAAMVALPGLTTSASAAPATPTVTTTTPIQHLVVIFDENVSFDHYFATYPNATNPSGEPSFTAKAGTPEVNGLVANSANGNQDLIDSNPNGVSPARLDRTTAGVLTCDQDHNYAPEQKAFDDGKMDQFLSNVATTTGNSPEGAPCNGDVDLDFYDGNVVTAMWNYAQNFALNDNSFGTTFGPSTPGAINVVSGDTGNVTKAAPSFSTANALASLVSDGQGAYSDIGDLAPYYDDCPDNTTAFASSGTNVGDQLNAAGVSWGWFQGGFAPTVAATAPTDDPNYVSPDGTYETGDTPAVCGATHDVGVALGGTGQYGTKSDYIAHHDPFQYFASTANPHHLAPASLSVVGTDTQSYVGGVPQFDTANHQYDLSVFNNLVSAIAHGTLPPSNLPAVSFLKAPGYEDGHQGYSDPLDEQAFITQEINALEQTPDWSSTAVVIAYDDSDGFYDHVDAATENGGQPQNSSQVATVDSLTGPGQCGTATPTLTNTAGEPEQGRCGYGPRLPLLVISPYAKPNFVDNTLTDQSSVVKFIEDNWNLGSIPGSAANIAGSIDNMFNFAAGPIQPTLYLDPTTGEPTTIPTPVLPESPFPVAMVGMGALIVGGVLVWQIRRRRRSTVNV